MLRLLGEISLHLTLFFALAAATLGVLAGRTGSRRYCTLATWGTYVVFGLIAIVCSTLLYGLATHDFEMIAVARYSDTRMHWMYLMAALWGGQAGSLTFWSGMLGVFTAISLTIQRKTDQPLIPYFITVTMSLMAFLVFILLFASNPFDTFGISDAPAEGSGLNPLLQTPLMVMHPPSLLSGFVSMAIPFAWCMSALMTGRTGNEWLRPARRWVLVSWLLLSIGNMLGGMWAYEELGWGGYWAWDPVENAAFMPWLAATAFLHSIMVQERRGMLKRWNVVLVTIAFLLTLLGTFITRSGLIQSVHSFAQSSIGTYFFALLGAAVTFSAVLLAMRWKDLKSEATMDSPLSREAVFLGNNWILVGMVFVVLWGTLFPKIQEMFTGSKVSVGPPWFNKYMVPLGIILVLLMGVGTLIAWKKSSLKNFRRNFLWPMAATFVITPAIAAAYWTLRATNLDLDLDAQELVYSIGGFAAAVFVIAASVSEFWRGLSARMKSHEEGLVEAVLGLLSRQRRRYGGYIIHIGFVLAVIGWSGSTFKVEQDVSMREGETVLLGDYEVKYNGLQEEEGPERTLITALLTVSRDGQEVAKMRPAQAIYHSSPQNPTSEIDIRTRPVEDLYFALAGFGENGQVASFKMLVSPLVWWFWFGIGVLIFGTVIVLWPEPLRQTQRSWGRATANAAVVASLAMLCASPLVLLGTVGLSQPVAQEHLHKPGEGPTVRVHNKELREIMEVVRVNCEASGRPTMANSSPTCSDFQSDMAIVERMLGEGKSKQEILDYFVELRGPDVLAMPDQSGSNWLIYLLPIAALLVAMALVGYKVRQWTASHRVTQQGVDAAAAAAGPKDEDDPYRKRLRQELADLR